MSDDFEKVFENIKKKIQFEEELTFSKAVLHEFRNPSNIGVIEKTEAIAQIKGPCGDTMKISLKIDEDKIVDARFWTDGCGPTIACGSMLTKTIKEKTIKQASNFTDYKLIHMLDGLPKEHIHCAKLAVDTLQEAIKNYHAIK